MLFKHPEQLAQLKADPSLAPAFVKELCRYHTGSALAMKRTAKVDVEIGGKVRSPPTSYMLSAQDLAHLVQMQARVGLHVDSAAHQGRRGHHRVQPVGQPGRGHLCQSGHL